MPCSPSSSARWTARGTLPRGCSTRPASCSSASAASGGCSSRPRRCSSARCSASLAGARPLRRRLRLLALVAPGDLMVNTPLDFITGEVNVELTLLYVVPGLPLPRAVPDHDAAFFAVSKSDPGTLDRLRPLYAAWPRPVLNDPAQIARLSRDGLSRGLAGLDAVCSPPTIRAGREQVEAWAGPDAPCPPLGRLPGHRSVPIGSHAGNGPGEARRHKRFIPRRLPQRDPRRERVLHRRLLRLQRRGRPVPKPQGRVRETAELLSWAHMAISERWMVHYLNADMGEPAVHRREEAWP